MKIGIVVYSQTGNTYSVALKLKEKLSAEGHTVNIESVTIAGGASQAPKELKFENLPGLDKYDALVFGAPVHAFSPAPVMTAYLKQLSSLKNKKIACYVTKQLPLAWTGGTQAIARMKNICKSKGAAVSGSVIIIWSKAHRQQSIRNGIDRLSGFFTP
jgi:flavodoxin